jgi:Zn-dependent membrane protease YugP
MFFGPYDWLFLPGLLLGLYAQFKLSSTYSRYSQVPAASGLSGADAAREILDRAGLHHMPVYETPGHLSDHYDPTKKALFLSSENFHGRSLAALGVAAHEAGHALQDREAYALLNFRLLLVPAAGFATTASFFLLMGGFLLASLRVIHAAMFAKLLGIAIALYAITTLFQLVTLPVEYDASRRAKERLLSIGLVDRSENDGINAVLSAAALTYVAALVTSVLELLRLVMIFRGMDRDDT